jgi:DNA primase
MTTRKRTINKVKDGELGYAAKTSEILMARTLVSLSQRFSILCLACPEACVEVCPVTASEPLACIESQGKPLKAGRERKEAKKGQAMETENKETLSEKQIAIIARIQKSLMHSIESAFGEVPRRWLKERKLSQGLTGAGFNSGQIHHRKPQEFLDELMSVGFLSLSGSKARTGKQAYTCFEPYAMTFPLKNEKNEVVNFYGIGVNSGKTRYMNEEGIYPAYPSGMTRRMFITDAILEAATLMESRVLKEGDSVIALFDGEFKTQHRKVLEQFAGKVDEFVFVRKMIKQRAMKNRARELKELVGKTRVREVFPERELNRIFVEEGSRAVEKLLEGAEEIEEVERTPLMVPLEQEEIIVPLKNDNTRPEQEKVKPERKSQQQDWPDETPKLEVIHEHKLLMKTGRNHYYVLGCLTQDLSSMRVTLLIEELPTGRKERTKIDLYEREEVKGFCMEMAHLSGQGPEEIEAELQTLTDLLEKHRETQVETVRPGYESKRTRPVMTSDKERECVKFLSSKNLMQNIDRLIEKTGVVGEENTRKLIFVIASTYKMTTPLHALVQGTSGSGKSHLINSIGGCLPPEDVLSMTRVTSKSFYHYSKEELVDKVILIQDYDGLDEEAQYAFRELQSAGNISSSTTYKDKYGNLVSAVKSVKSHFASLLATTKAEVYYDNMSRSVIIGVDESDEQTGRIIEYQNRKLAGLIDGRDEKEAREFLQNCIRCLKPYEVVNRYADKIRLPAEAKMLRRLNSHYQAFVKQITILNQYQREKDSLGRLIAEPEDLQIACDILFDAIMLKVDDLDTCLRQFFDRMKLFIQSQAKEKGAKMYEFQFTQRDVRLFLNTSKTQCFRYMEDLELLEYVQKVGGYANRGFKYKIVFWDDMEKVRTKIKAELGRQLNGLLVVREVWEQTDGKMMLVQGARNAKPRTDTKESR